MTISKYAVMSMDIINLNSDFEKQNNMIYYTCI